jgi:kynurenine formamidase
MSKPTLVDLTMTLTPEMRGVSWEPARTIEKDGWNARSLHLYSHCGTHMDAPLHFGCGDQATIDQTPLETCLSVARVADISGIQPAGLIEISDLGDVADRHQPGQSILLKTGWSAFANDAGIYRDRLPRVSESLAQWCVESKVCVLGVEPPSVADVNNRPELTKIHEILLSGGVTIVEGLTNLDQLPDESFLFGAMPLKVLGGDGAPCRAFASLTDLYISPN